MWYSNRGFVGPEVIQTEVVYVKVCLGVNLNSNAAVILGLRRYILLASASVPVMTREVLATPERRCENIFHEVRTRARVYFRGPM